MPSVQTEVIVADTGSTGGLPEIQEAARARVSGARESGSFQPSRGLTQTTLLCCAFFLACLGGSGLRGQNFTAEGTVSYQSHVSTSGDGDLPPPDRRTFTITVKESQWLMRVEGGHDTINYTEIGHDAESLFVYRSHAQDRVQQRLGAPIPVPAGSGQIIPGAVPGHDETHAHYVWLGLASHRHFVKIDTGRLVTPPWLAADARRDRVPCDILLSKRSEPFLPEELVYWEPISSGSGLDVPWVRGKFKRLEEIETNGGILPSGWEFIEYRLREGAVDPADTEVQSIITVSIQHFREPEGSFSPLPNFNGPTLVSDYRYRIYDPPADRVGYLITSGIWPGVDDIVPMREYIAVVQRVKKGEYGIDTPASIIRVYLVAAFALILTIPAIVYYFDRKV